MAGYLSQRLDYVFFFYGLAFILLASVCFTIKKEDKSPLLWNWLGYFGLAHGLNEWLDLLAFSFYDGPAFTLARSVLLGASFYFLAAFGRRSRLPLTGRALSPWFYLPLTLLGLLGLGYGPDGFNASIRLAIGFPGALLAAYSAWLASGLDGTGRRPLRVMAAALAVYALAAGLVVPESSFLPARHFSHAHFTAFFGFPVQLLRGVLAVIIACAAWSYSLELNAAGRHREKKARAGWGTIAALLLAVFVGWGVTDLTGASARRNMVRDAESMERILHNRLADYLAKAQESALSASRSPLLDGAMGRRDPDALARMNAIMDRYCESYGFAVCYLMDMKGDVIAASNRHTPQSLLGRNYAFRPYFTRAAAGGSAAYFALGVTTGERGFYASSPVMSGRKVAGVAVIKERLDFLAEELRQLPDVFFVSPDGVIFLSSRKDLLFRSLWPVPPEKRAELTSTKQFGELDFSPLLPGEPRDDEEIFFAGDKFYVSRQPVGNDGWSVVAFTSTHQVRMARFAGITISFVFCTVLLIFFLLLVQSESERESAEALLALKAEVETLSGILPICASCKKIRDDKGYWNRVETYISKRSQAQFSHGLCPDCARKLYPGYSGTPPGEDD